jgi:hypothetical protein
MKVADYKHAVGRVRLEARKSAPFKDSCVQKAPSFSQHRSLITIFAQTFARVL